MLTALFWMLVTTGAAIAHNGEDQAGDARPLPLWIGFTVAAVFLTVIFSLIRRGDVDLTGLEVDERADSDDR